MTRDCVDPADLLRDAERELAALLTRRQFFGRMSLGLGTAALATLLGRDLRAAPGVPDDRRRAGGLPGIPHFAPKARRVIYLFQAGAPSQMDLFDHKPMLAEMHGKEIPKSVVGGQRLTGMTSGQASFPIASSMFRFEQRGECGAWVSELLPHTAKVVDDICILKTLHTEAINHDPAISLVQTGSQQPGRPSFGSWCSYGLGTENESLPAFVVLISKGSSKRDAQPLYARLWGSGFLPSVHQGSRFRSGDDPVLFIANPPGLSATTRRNMLDVVGKLNKKQLSAYGDPEIATRIAQYELAFRMQTTVPELADISGEPESVLDLYGPDVRKPGTYARNCLLARRLAERGVRFIQLYHRGWDQHFNLPNDIRLQCADTDQASAALVRDLKQRGMLEDTLVVWGGEFGRTTYCQGELTKENYGRDHHPRCFTVWLAGGGIRPGISVGTTDDFSYNIVEDPYHVHDFQATILHCLGVDHERMTFKFQGRDFRLTDVAGDVIQKILV